MEANGNGRLIFWTKDYEIFSLLKGNRPQNPNWVKRLKSLILANGWRRSSLLIVSNSLTILDGQHRIWALKEILRETGKVFEIGYVIDNSLGLVGTRILNSSSLSWKPRDYIMSNIKLGNKDYQFIQELMDQFKLSYTSVIALVTKGNSSSTLEKFRNGDVYVENREEAFDNAVKLGEIKPYYAYCNNKNFVIAMLFFFNKKEFNFDEFLSKLAQNRNMLYPVTTINEYKRLIQTLYNYRRRDKVTFIQE